MWNRSSWSVAESPAYHRITVSRNSFEALEDHNLLKMTNKIWHWINHARHQLSCCYNGCISLRYCFALGWPLITDNKVYLVWNNYVGCILFQIFGTSSYFANFSGWRVIWFNVATSSSHNNLIAKLCYVMGCSASASRTRALPRFSEILFIRSYCLPRCMECRRGLAMRILSVRPSVCPSVRPSHVWIVTKR